MLSFKEKMYTSESGLGISSCLAKRVSLMWIL